MPDSAITPSPSRLDRGLPGNTVVRLCALLLVLSFPAIRESSHITAFFNGDVWWHLQTGLWMLQHHAAPHSGIFSQAANQAWVASNWAADLMLAIAYRVIGLKSLLAELVFFKSAWAAVAFLVAYAARRRFWTALALCVLAQYSLADTQPLPIFFSMILFGVVASLLLGVRRTGNLKLLYALPPIFLLWANLHLEFVYGLLILGLFALTTALEAGWPQLRSEEWAPASSLPLGLTLAFCAAGAVATLFTPYGVNLYGQIGSALFDRVQFASFTEMAAMEFRSCGNFVVLGLLMTAFLAMGRRRSRDIFKLAALAIFAMLAFRIQRDVWAILLLSICVIAEADTIRPEAQSGHEWKPVLGVIGFVLLILPLALVMRLPDDATLLRRASSVLPVAACDAIRAQHLPAPIYNTYQWGGFLDWYLPEYPVSIDGRISLWGDAENETYFKLVGASMKLEDSPVFMRAGTILLERNSGLAQALTSLPALRDQYRVAYQDDLAIVVVRVSATP
jgi:hypothetical protein